MKYRILVLREPEEGAAVVDPTYEDFFDTDEDSASIIGNRAGQRIEQAIVRDLAGFGEGES